MDSLQFWLYVIIGVIYLISQVRKKSREQMPQGKPASKPTSQAGTPTTPWKSETTSTQPASSQKPMTFEELLREITEGKASKEPTYEEPYKQPEYIDYDDDIEDEEEAVLEESRGETFTDYRQTDTFKLFEDAKNYDYEANSLENTLKLESVDMRFGKFKEFETENQRNLLEEYTADLRDPDGFKKAVILSEILNRRHFWRWKVDFLTKILHSLGIGFFRAVNFL